MNEPRRFTLMRDVDVSDVSGTGAVAQGVQFGDGAVALRWRGKYASTNCHASLDSVLGVHGHDGLTRVEWIDPPSAEPAS